MKVLQPTTLLYIATFQLILQGSVPPPHLLRAQNVSDNRSIPDVTLDQLQKVRLLRCRPHHRPSTFAAGAAARHGQRAHQAVNSVFEACSGLP